MNINIKTEVALVIDDIFIIIGRKWDDIMLARIMIINRYTMNYAIREPRGLCARWRAKPTQTNDTQHFR